MRLLLAAACLLLALGAVSLAESQAAQHRRLAPARNPRMRPFDAEPNGEQCGNGNTYCTDGEVCTQGHDCVVVCGLALCWQEMQDSWSDCPGGGCVCQ